MNKLKKLYEKYEDEYLKFNKVENKLSNRPDLHAFILLDKLFPSKMDMIVAAEHDEFCLEVEPDKLSRKATEEQILELIRCGVMYDEYKDSLTMFA